jgi:hypothetical protein
LCSKQYTIREVKREVLEEEGRAGRPAITATNKGKYETLFLAKNCAQIVPVKVKFFQIKSNEAKNDF